MKKPLQPKMLLELIKKHRKLKRSKLKMETILLRVLINSFNSLMKKKDKKAS